MTSSVSPNEHNEQRQQPLPVALHHHLLPPLHGVNIATSDTMPMTAPFTVPYNRDNRGELSSPVPASLLPASASANTSLPPPSPADGMAAKMAAGGLSCMLISAVFNPMDVVKIRLQTQNQLQSTATTSASSAAGATGTTAAAAPVRLSAAPRSPSAASPVALSMYADSKYKGMTHGLITIYKEEGYCRGLMRGSAGSAITATAAAAARCTLRSLSLSACYSCCLSAAV
jgi:hypothetical protein